MRFHQNSRKISKKYVCMHDSSKHKLNQKLKIIMTSLFMSSEIWEKNEVERTMKAESGMAECLVACKACKATFWITPSLTERTSDSSGFSAQMTTINFLHQLYPILSRCNKCGRGGGSYGVGHRCNRCNRDTGTLQNRCS